MRACVCVCACVHACVRACVRVYVKSSQNSPILLVIFFDSIPSELCVYIRH